MANQSGNERILSIFGPRFSSLKLVDDYARMANTVWDRPAPFFADMPILPKTEITYNDDIHIKMELPGVKREDIAVMIDGATLTMTAIADATQGKLPRHYRHLISLPFSVDPAKIVTRFDHDILELVFKAEDARPTLLDIQAGPAADSG